MRGLVSGTLAALAALTACEPPPPTLQEAVASVVAMPRPGVPAPLPSPVVTSRQGCLGYPLDACLASLQSSMVIDQPFVAASLAARHAVDVNGRKIGRSGVTITARLADRLDLFAIVLSLTPDDIVIAAETSLSTDPAEALTESGYDRTGMFELVERLLGNKRCPGLTPQGLYRFFENSVKPHRVFERKDQPGGLFGVHSRFSYTTGTPFCGTTFSYGQLFRWRGGHDPTSGRQLTNVIAIKMAL